MPTPDQIANLEMWYKADAITGLVDNDPVGTWLDSSGNGRDMTQATASKKPLYKTNQVTFGGKPVVRFDGTDDGLKRAGAILTNNAGTIFAVVKCTKASGNADIIVTADEASASFWCIQRFGATNLKLLGGYNNQAVGNVFTGNTVMNRDDRFIMMWGSSGTAYRARVNGVEQTRDFSGGSDDGMWWDDIANRDNWTIGLYNGNVEANFFQGDIAELVVYSRLLTAQEISDIETYLGDKYPAPINSDHVVPIQLRVTVNLDSVIPVQLRYVLNADSGIPIEWDISGLIRSDHAIPLQFRTRLEADSVIPISIQLPGGITVDFVIPIQMRQQLDVDQIIPILWKLFSDWVAQAASQSDAWAQQAASQADAWTKQGGSQSDADALGQVLLGDFLLGGSVWTRRE